VVDQEVQVSASPRMITVMEVAKKVQYIINHKSKITIIKELSMHLKSLLMGKAQSKLIDLVQRE